jgi:NADH:ubiquinone oxidoreductase subunit 4 (subunit M)
MRDVQDLRAVEMAAAGVLSLGILVLGIAPGELLAILSASVAQLSDVFAGG